MRFDLARPGDDDALRRLLRENPMDGTVRVTLEREPNGFLATTIEGDCHRTVVARAADGGRLIGIGSLAVMTAFVNGAPARVGYLSQLRIDRTQPARARALRGGFGMLGELRREEGPALCVTTIIEDNVRARRLLEAGLPGLPRYEPIDELVTLVIPVTARAGRTGASPPLVRGPATTWDEIAECLDRNARRHQLARRWTIDDLRSGERTRGLGLGDFAARTEGGRVTGCAAVWDQRAFKQTVVAGYAPWLATARPLLNLAAPLLRHPRLPAPGRALAAAFASHVAVDDDDPETAIALLRHACADARSRNVDYLSVGFSRRRPLVPAVKRAFAHREYVSIVYRVSWPDHVDGAPELDHRIPHLEVATL